MITIGMWEETNKKKIIAILFSILLTPLTLLADIICPFINVANILYLFGFIWDKVNGR